MQKNNEYSDEELIQEIMDRQSMKIQTNQMKGRYLNVQTYIRTFQKMLFGIHTDKNGSAIVSVD